MLIILVLIIVTLAAIAAYFVATDNSSYCNQSCKTTKCACSYEEDE